MSVATDKARIAAYIDENLKERVEQLAKARGRSLSNLVERVLLKEVEDAVKSGEIKENNPAKVEP